MFIGWNYQRSQSRVRGARDRRRRSAKYYGMAYTHLLRTSAMFLVKWYRMGCSAASNTKRIYSVGVGKRWMTRWYAGGVKENGDTYGVAAAAALARHRHTCQHTLLFHYNWCLGLYRPCMRIAMARRVAHFRFMRDEPQTRTYIHCWIGWAAFAVLSAKKGTQFHFNISYSHTIFISYGASTCTMLYTNDRSEQGRIRI